MALITCTECGTEFSDKAKACTKCGAPPKKKTSLFTWVVTIILGLWLISVISNQGSSPESNSGQAIGSTTTNEKPQEMPSQSLDKSPAMQKKRSKQIQEFKSQGIFVEVEHSDSDSVWVTVGPTFYSLDFKDKQGLVSVIYAYYFDGSHDLDLVMLKDSKTDKTIGSFSKISGLSLD